MKKSILFGIGTLAIVAALAGCGRKEKVIASVNGDTITENELYQAMDFARSARVIGQNGQAAEAQIEGRFGYQVVQDLIKRKLTIQIAKDKKLAPSDKEIDAEIDFQKKLNPDFLTQQLSVGISLANIKSNLRYQMCIDRILTQGIDVKTSDAEKVIKDNPEQFMEPEKARVSWILLFRNNAVLKDQVDNELLSGQSFSNLAVRFSDDPNAGSLKGAYSDGPTNRLPEQVQKLIKGMKVGEKSKWIESTEGYAKFYLESREPTKKMAMNDAKIEMLRRRIALIRGSQAKDLNQLIYQKLKETKSDIKIEDKGMKIQWQNDLKKIQEAEENKKKKKEAMDRLNNPSK